MYQTTRRVEFRDTDAAGIVHFSAFFPLMESVEHECLRAHGLTVMAPAENGTLVTWPRVAAECQYYSPARFEDVLQISFGVQHLGTKSVRYRCTFAIAERLVARGMISAVCCCLHSHQLQSVVIPESMRAVLKTLLLAESTENIGPG